MMFRSEIAPGGALLFAAIVAVATLAEAEDGIVLEGAQSATLRWDPAGGPVAGYYVVVSKNGGPLRLDGISVDPVETIDGEFGDTLVVQIAAFDTGGLPGPLSPPSDPIHFVAPPEGDPSGNPAEDPVDENTDPTDQNEPGFADFDFTRDGRSDVLLEDVETGRLRLWQMDGLRVEATHDLPTLPANAVVRGSGDFDGNGITDLLLRDEPSGRLTLWMLGDDLALLEEVDMDLDPSWQVAGCADFDGDARDEVAIFHFELAVIEWLALGAGELVSLGELPKGLGGPWLVAGTADYDGNGRADVLWSDARGRTFELWSMDGVHADFAGGFANPSQDSGEVVGSADHDGDGNADLLVHYSAAGRSEVWSLEGGQIIAITDLPSGMGETFEVVGQGDYDGNGQSDALWFDAGTGESIVWALSGLDVGEGKLVADAPLRVVAAGRPLRAPALDTCRADFDGDGIVSGVDFAFFSGCFGDQPDTSCEPADLDFDGSVGGHDYRIFQLSYGREDCGT